MSIPTPLEYEPRRRRRGGRVGTLIAWIAIVLITCIVFLGQMRRGATASERPPTPAENVQLQLSGRQIIGTRYAAQLAGKDESDAQLSQQLQPVLRAMAPGSADRLAIVPVLAEIRGRDAALKELSSYESIADPLATDAAALRKIYSESPDALTAAERERLISQYKWLGELALTWEKPQDDAARKSVMRAALRTLIGVGVFGLGVAIAIAAGLILLIIAIIRFADGKLLPMFAASVPEDAHETGGVYVEAFAVYLTLMLGLGVLAHSVFETERLLNPGLLLIGAAPIACLWPLLRGERWHDLRRSLGWHAGRGWTREIFAGIVGYLAGLPVIVIGIFVTFLLARFAGAAPSHPLSREISANLWRVIALFGLATVYAPIAEETMFRGTLFRAVRPAIGMVLGTLLVSFIFAAIHPQGWSGVPLLMCIAIVLASLREWRGSLIAPIVAHAINNGVVVLLLVVVAG